MSKKFTRSDALRLLREKHSEILDIGISRYPQRADFTEDEVVAIKSYFGPWPRALEAAGIKPPRDDERRQKKIDRQVRAKRAKIAALKRSNTEKRKNKAAETNQGEP